MKTITFYSYKGGVGRTLAAANFAVYLARLGHSAALLDFDLDAPGLDSKFPNLRLPDGQKGILDYILEFQRTGGDAGQIMDIACDVPLSETEHVRPLRLIPAGDYMSPRYYSKLDELDWKRIFSQERAGVAFFQQLLRRIEDELGPDFLIVDSRTGISEIAGLCTQQLADEVVLLTSLSSESVKVTKRLASVIKDSDIAKALGKTIDVKIVVSRTPRPNNVDDAKEQFCSQFGVDHSHLFFLFSSRGLESEEYVALVSRHKDEELIDDYVRLFNGLDTRLANVSILHEIEKIGQKLLLLPPDEVEDNVKAMAALYPHPEVYRMAMRFFRLIGKRDGIRTYSRKVVDLLPGDLEAQRALANTYLSEPFTHSSMEDAVRALEPLWHQGQLQTRELLRLADMLEDVKRYKDSFDLALKLSGDPSLDQEGQKRALIIACRDAARLGLRDVVEKMIGSIPQEDWGPTITRFVLETREADGDIAGAFDIGLRALSRGISPGILDSTARYAQRLNRRAEFEAAIRGSGDFARTRYADRFDYEPFEGRELSAVLRRHGYTDLAREIRSQTP